MSVVFVIVPSLAVGGWPLLAAAIAAACSALGYHVLKGERRQTTAANINGSVTLTLDAQALSDALERDETISVFQGDVTITFYKDPRGRVTMHVDGKNKTEAELREIGQTVMNRILQQYAYQRVMQELEKRGFTVVHEEVDENQVIKIRVRRPV
ncbi:MAG: DUF1257 domain-containing protein [Armatimonadetes bacterium]|nr:DUF1257 domain-containing protein [Armatimonadota bacterium]MCX7969479.1 DUF1257 domain-containing protein [Armatimonadota bacterium]MDW8141992.1 DUF1257 domain-containing protein [Armatimonadota bacterium]